jgi:hypothetical protein
MRRERRINLLVAALVVFVVVAVPVAGYIVLFDPRIFPGCHLDRQRWDEARELIGHGRSAEGFEKAEPEVEDIVKCDHLVYGKPRAEIIALLGRPSNRAGDNPRVFFYNVGIPEGLSDYPGLEIRFDERGMAAEASVAGYIER